MENRILIKNVSIVDVINECITMGDILICGDRFEKVGTVTQNSNSGIQIEGKGLYAIPGLIDGHTHVELSLVSCASFAETLLKNGTTAAVLDPHDAVNVLGVKGAEFLMKEMQSTDLTAVWMAPPCVPSAPGLEDCGCEITLEETKVMIEELGMFGIAETMDYNRAINSEPELKRILDYAKSKSLKIDGHAPMLVGEALDKYIASGPDSDHESITVEEMIEKHQKGMTVILRRGSLKEPAKSAGLLEQLGSTDRVLLSTDGCINLKDMIHKGHMNYALAQLVAEGTEPMAAIKMATVNVAEAYGLTGRGAIKAGNIADLCLVEDLINFRMKQVFVSGRPVPEELRYERCKLPAEVAHSVKRKFITGQDLCYRLSGGDSHSANILRVIDGTLATEKEIRSIEILDGEPVLPEDIMYCCVIHRYEEEGSIGLGLVSGFGCFKGALAGSIAQDTQNIIGMGNKKADIVAAVNEVIRHNGGISFIPEKDNEKKQFVELPVMGIMSQKPSAELVEELDELEVKLRAAGAAVSNPMLTLSLQIPLAVIPELAITNRGLLHVTTGEFIPI